MKKLYITFITISLFAFSSCSSTSKQSEQAFASQTESVTRLSSEELKALSFNDLFKESDVKGIEKDPFTLVGEHWSILTAGTPNHFNSMVASWGGWGILFNKPTVFHFLRSNRYTLELMRKEQTYTVSFFDKEYQDELMNFGNKSGRDTNKMKETKLNAVQTPSGNTTYKEAMLVLECQLLEVTTVSPDDYSNEEQRKFVTDAFAETHEYHKLVMSEITKVWVRK